MLNDHLFNYNMLRFDENEKTNKKSCQLKIWIILEIHSKYELKLDIPH